MYRGLGDPGRCQVGEEVENLGLGMRGVCLGIIDMGIGFQEARASSPCVRATAGSLQELEFGARSGPKF
jgi:hypothetical protein